MGLNVFLIGVHPGVYPSVLSKASDSIFNCSPKFSVGISAVFADGLEQRIEVSYTVEVTLRPLMQDGADSYKAIEHLVLLRQSRKKCHFTQLKFYK